MFQFAVSLSESRLNAYIYDYLMKKQLYETAKVFHEEGAVETGIVMDAPGGFLYEWWSVFWELFMAKQGLSNSEQALSYLQFQQNKAEEMRKQEGLESLQFASQSPAQQQQYGAETQVLNSNVVCPINYGSLARSPLHVNGLEDTAIEIMKSYIRGGHPIEDCAFLWNATTALTGGQASGQTFPSAPSILQGNLQQVQNPNRLLLGSTQCMNIDMSAMMRSRAVVSEGSLIGVHGSNQGGSDLTLKGRPFAGHDQLHAEILQKHNLIMSSQYSNQFLQRQQLMLQAQQNSFNPSVSSFDGKRPRLLLNNQIVVPGKDGQSSSVGGSIPNIGTPSQIDFPELLPYMDMETLLKATKSQGGRKQKRKVGSYSGPGNTSGTANTVGPSSGSPSTPSMQTPLPTPQQNDLGSLASTQNQLAGMGHLKSGGSLGENLADAVHKGRVGTGFSLKEIKHGMASSHIVDCCHFSSDGKLLVTGGHDKKASLWCTKSFNLQSTLEEHTQRITDVRFCPSMFCVATSSADKTVKVWDVNNLQVLYCRFCCNIFGHLIHPVVEIEDKN
ncbi:transcriptional corepressor LEUNIG-like protein [Trifolium pratense]|uniref:Transcriptional corepressor LEUNIG-like protein n=1 Tax=Trifolium pratense TaxID=57577 RepID=A0A2K3PFP3_TRIPR|nr:transcriptional corepressor LEUNIG-like protein [Trifolium pratense]